MMEEQLPYRAEYAKTGRAKCKGCKTGIDSGELRVAVMVQSGFHDGKQANWYHCDCFFLKQRPKCTTEIAYFFTLKYDDQQKLKGRIESNVVTPSTAALTDKGKKRAKQCDALKDFGIEYSKSSRAECRACQQKIIKGEIRIKKVSFDTEVGMKYGGQALWHHVECFEKVSNELLYFESGDQLPGFKSLKKNDQEMVKKTIQPKTGAPEVKKIKKEEEDPEQKAKDLELEAKMKEQNDKFYEFFHLLEQLSKHELNDLITHNNQKIPDTLAEVKALNLAADLLTFGTPGKCLECNNGMLTLGNNTYVCNGSIDEWAKCSYKNQDPPRTKTIIPGELKDKFPFLKSYKGKITKRLFHAIAPKVQAPEINKKDVDETDKPKVQREKPKLYKMIFLVVGKTQTNLAELKNVITKFGGEVKTKLSDKITAVISNQQEIDKMNQRMKDVKNLNIPVISDDFFIELNKDSDTIQLMQKFNISPWIDVLTSVPKKLDEMEEERKPHKSAFMKSSKSSKVTMQIKGGGAVDPDSKLESFAHVYAKDGVTYNSILSIADLQTGQNSFYKLQILQSDTNKNQFWLFRSWGRIGTTVGGNKVDTYCDEDAAIRKFRHFYTDKTRNIFGSGNFQKHPGFYNPIDVEFEEIQNKFSKECKIPSKLDEPIQNLIKLIFNIDLMQQTMIQFEIDTEKMPLGKLSKSQIAKALIALNDLTVLIDRKAKESEFISPTNRFYTLIPHNFGMKAPTMLNSIDIIKQKVEMLESLMEIELAYSLLNDVNITDTENPVDVHYDQLKTEMEVLDPNSDEFKSLQLYVKNTHARTHNMYDLEITNIFKINREGESDRFQKFKNLHNHKLLWHGSRLTNFVGILKNGLRIAPPEAPCTGYMFGKGIYFADMVSKSANYCFTSPINNTGILLLCDVALGNMQEYTSAHYVTQLPNGKHSTKGVGNTEPDSKGAIKNDDYEIPCGQPVTSLSRSHLLYNEYIIYDIEQVNVKYLLNMKFKYNCNY